MHFTESLLLIAVLPCLPLQVVASPVRTKSAAASKASSSALGPAPASSAAVSPSASSHGPTPQSSSAASHSSASSLASTRSSSIANTAASSTASLAASASSLGTSLSGTTSSIGTLSTTSGTPSTTTHVSTASEPYSVPPDQSERPNMLSQISNVLPLTTLIPGKTSVATEPTGAPQGNGTVAETATGAPETYTDAMGTATDFPGTAAEATYTAASPANASSIADATPTPSGVSLCPGSAEGACENPYNDQTEHLLHASFDNGVNSEKYYEAAMSKGDAKKKNTGDYLWYDEELVSQGMGIDPFGSKRPHPPKKSGNTFDFFATLGEMDQTTMDTNASRVSNSTRLRNRAVKTTHVLETYQSPDHDLVIVQDGHFPLLNGTKAAELTWPEMVRDVWKHTCARSNKTTSSLKYVYHNRIGQKKSEFPEAVNTLNAMADRNVAQGQNATSRPEWVLERSKREDKPYFLAVLGTPYAGHVNKLLADYHHEFGNLRIGKLHVWKELNSTWNVISELEKSPA